MVPLSINMFDIVVCMSELKSYICNALKDETQHSVPHKYIVLFLNYFLKEFGSVVLREMFLKWANCAFWGTICSCEFDKHL